MPCSVSLETQGRNRISSVMKGNVSGNDGANIKDYVKKLIKDGRIKFVDPSRRAELKDEEFFDKNGIPYAGYTSWEDGKMKIVRSPI